MRQTARCNRPPGSWRPSAPPWALADQTSGWACIFRLGSSNHRVPVFGLGRLYIGQSNTEEKNHGQSFAPHETLDQDRTARQHCRRHGAVQDEVAAVLEALGSEIQKSLGNKGAGAITIPGLVKIEKKKVPARKAEKGVPNPFKPRELMDRPAKPAYNKVKVRALKTLKDMAK